MGADPQLTGVQWPAAASTLYCAQILNWQTKHSILYNCSIMMQHYYYRISTFAGYSLSNIANTTLWNLMISLRIDHFEPIPCHCLSGSAQRPWKEDLCASPLCTTHHFHVIVVILLPQLSYWKTLSTPSVFISFGMFANCSQVCDCHKLNFFIFLIPL